MSIDDPSARWPVGLALLATAIGVMVVFLVVPEGREARAVMAHGTLLVSSVAADGGYPHYHRPTDEPDNVNVETVVAARRLCAELVRQLDTK